MFVTHRPGRLNRSLRRETGGAALVEFALALPFLIFSVLLGIEVGYLAIARLQVGYLAMTTAENAAQMVQIDDATVAESDIASAIKGTLAQGDTIHFGDAGRGRVILTSLQGDPATKAQTIGWRRCGGTMNQATAYPSVTASGLGSGTSKVTAAEGSAVMFVEVYYLHKGLFGTLFFNNRTLSREAAFIVKDKRNMTAAPTGTNTTAC